MIGGNKIMKHDFKESIQERWEHSAKGYSDGIQQDFDTKVVETWQNLILHHIVLTDKPLEILDVGTGPGYFANILSMAGHNVTAIDCAKNMLEEAKINADMHHVYPKFYQMDSHLLSFQPESFDMIVSRNVTWTLYDPIHAFKQWHHVLKPGGKLVIFDANWHLHQFEPSLYKKVMQGCKENEARPSECAYQGNNPKVLDYYKDMPLARIQRPKWDEETLPQLGFEIIQIQPCLNAVVYNIQDQMKYEHIPLFQIVAQKV